MKKRINYILTAILLFISVDSANAITRECVKCGEDALEIPALLPNFVSSLITLAQVLVPIVLIVTGLIKYLKAVTSGEDKVIAETNESFIKSIIAAISVFLIVTLVRFTFNVVEDAGSDDTTSCISCFVTGECPSTTCIARNGTSPTYTCYQCNSNPSVYKWDSTSTTDDSCTGGYHSTNKSQADCHS